MKHINCPKCGKELVFLEPIQVEGIYSYWCDDCDIEVKLVSNKELGNITQKIRSEIRETYQRLAEEHKAAASNAHIFALGASVEETFAFEKESDHHNITALVFGALADIV